MPPDDPSSFIPEDTIHAEPRDEPVHYDDIPVDEDDADEVEDGELPGS